MSTKLWNKDEKLIQACSLLEEAMKERYDGWEGVEQFNGTGDRLVRLYNELCWLPEDVEAEAKNCVKVFNNAIDEMIVVGPFSVYILCPHHLLPCRLKVSVGYIPSAGKVLGLSKLPRVAEVLAHRPILQEQYCQELADFFERQLNPIGVAVSVVGEHSCMGARGVGKFTPVTTNVMRGAFMSKPESREEFLHRTERVGR